MVGKKFRRILEAANRNFLLKFRCNFGTSPSTTLGIVSPNHSSPPYRRTAAQGATKILAPFYLLALNFTLKSKNILLEILKRWV